MKIGAEPSGPDGVSAKEDQRELVMSFVILRKAHLLTQCRLSQLHHRK